MRSASESGRALPATMMCSRPRAAATRWPSSLQAEAEGDVHRGLEARAADLAVALQRVAVAEVEQRAGMEDGQVDRRALADVGGVHVPAEGPGPEPVKRLVALGRHGHAARASGAGGP